MGSGYAKMKKQRRQMEEQMAKWTEKMQNTEYEGVAGNGLVKVVLDGEKTLKKLDIKKECVDPEDIDGLTDLILGAYEEAAEKVAKASEDNPLPGLF